MPQGSSQSCAGTGAVTPSRRPIRPDTAQVPKRPEPPFAPVGVESRGGERFIAGMHFLLD